MSALKIAIARCSPGPGICMVLLPLHHALHQRSLHQRRQLLRALHDRCWSARACWSPIVNDDLHFKKSTAVSQLAVVDIISNRSNKLFGGGHRRRRHGRWHAAPVVRRLALLLLLLLLLFVAAAAAA